MKSSPTLFAVVALVTISNTHAQGTFLYDQQSSVEGSYLEGAVGDITAAQPTGQSFTPGLTSIGFIRLFLYDAGGPGNPTPGTLAINLRSTSITGNILASTDAVTLQPHFGGIVNFYFANPVTLTPGTTYFFQPVVESGSTWGLYSDRYTYAGGMVFTHGMGVPGDNYWFREGIVVPEPSTTALMALAGALLLCLRRTKINRPFRPR